MKVGYFVTACCIVGILSEKGFDQTSRPALAAAEPPAKNAPQKASGGGVPIQRKRIDTFIEQVAKMDDYASLVKGLDEPVACDFDIVFHAGLNTSDINPQTEFLRVLADRRVARLYEMLSKMPKDTAAERAAALLKSKVQQYESAVNDGFDDWLNDDGKMKPVPVRLYYHSIASSFFLCSVFCNDAQYSECLKLWRQSWNRVSDRLHSNDRLAIFSIELEMSGPPESLFLVNCFVLRGDTKGCLLPLDVQSEHFGIGQACEFRRIPYSRWNAHTNAFDFTHIHRGVPIDRKAVLREIYVARGWGGLELKKEKQQCVVEFYQDRLEECQNR